MSASDRTSAIDALRPTPAPEDIPNRADVAASFQEAVVDNLTTQTAQVACFRNAAAHLEPGGRFVIETGVPPIQRMPYGETKRAFACSDTHWGIDTFDVVTQQYASHHIWIDDGEHSRLSVPFRYAWPSELDLMAQLAGLELEHRWGGWDRAPFTATSTKHVSVWRKMADGS